MLRTRQQNTNENRKNRYISYKHLVKSGRKSVGSFKTRSFSSTEFGAFDSYSLSSDIGFSSYSKSKSSPSESSSSGLHASWLSGDATLVMPHHWGEHRKSSDLRMSKAKVTEVTDTSDKGCLKLIEESCELVVIGNGTKLMRDIHFPTVFVQMPNKKLQDSVVYYAILEPISGLNTGDIACLLFASCYRDKEEIQTAELLPLKIVTPGWYAEDISLSPMLLHERDKFVFQERCTFKVKAIECGRRSDWKQRPWNDYELENWEINNLLKRLITLDIRQMPKQMLKQLTLPVAAKPRKESRKVRRKKSFQSFLTKKNAKVRIPSQKLSRLHPDLRLHGLVTMGGSSFADWFNAVPPNVLVDKDFICDRNTKLKKDTFKNSCDYDEYLKISDTI